MAYITLLINYMIHRWVLVSVYLYQTIFFVRNRAADAIALITDSRWLACEWQKRHEDPL